MDSVDVLRELGQRITTPRVAVLDAILSATDEHLTAEVVYAKVQAADGAAVHRTTVYRTLDALTQAGVLRHVHLDRGITAYHLVAPDSADAPTSSHLHAQCSQCGRIVDLPVDVLGDLATRIRAASGFEFDAGHVALSGLCVDCAARTPHVHRATE